MRRLLVIALSLAAGCAHDHVGVVRFYDREVVSRVDDRKNIPQPEPYEETLMPYYLDVLFVRRFTRWTEMHDTKRAMNVNAMDEVPDSTWYVNRIAARDVTPEEIRRGPGDGHTPETFKPWAVKRLKVGGTSVGFVAQDTSGYEFMLKFDTKGYPEVETSADVIVQRLFWALGFNVPDDDVVTFSREELVIADGAKKRDPFGKEQPLTEKDLEDELTRVDLSPDGRYRAQVSRFIPGKLLGGWKVEGTRKDDANDTVPHQHRREVRASKLFHAWVGDIDTKQMNTLDAWVEDPADPEIHYVKHYFVDFGKSMGAWRDELHMPYDGWASTLDVGEMAYSLITFGFGYRPWEHMVYPHLRGVGWFESKVFDPDLFEGAYPYYPHTLMDAADGFWAAKLIMRFSPEQIAAAVASARYSDSASADYVTKTLIERQRKIGEVWFRRVTPLDGIRLSANGEQLCFDDLLIRHELAHGETTYRATAYDTHGRATGWKAEAKRGAKSEIVCMRDLELATDGYTIIALTVTRADKADGESLKPILVHLAGSNADDVHIIGLRREHEE